MDLYVNQIQLFNAHFRSSGDTRKGAIPATILNVNNSESHLHVQDSSTDLLTFTLPPPKPIGIVDIFFIVFCV